MSAALIEVARPAVCNGRGLPGLSGPILNAQGTSHEERWGGIYRDRYRQGAQRGGDRDYASSPVHKQPTATQAHCTQRGEPPQSSINIIDMRSYVEYQCLFQTKLARTCVRRFRWLDQTTDEPVSWRQRSRCHSERPRLRPRRPVPPKPQRQNDDSREDPCGSKESTGGVATGRLAATASR